MFPQKLVRLPIVSWFNKMKQSTLNWIHSQFSSADNEETERKD
jgi:hypothetical protein